MRNFERITASPEALGMFLASISVGNSPWDDAFHKQYCTTCQQMNCDPCPYQAARSNPTWWLIQTEENETAKKKTVP